MNLKIHFSKIYLSIVLFTLSLNYASAQNGDQILDGIGETSMVARYVFNGNARDWSRNNLHAQLNGTGAKFVNDPRFGNVLSLDGDNASFLTIPAKALADLESLSISGWLYLRSNQQGQHFFDFGRNVDNHYYVAPAGTKTQNGFVAQLIAQKQPEPTHTPAILQLNTWTHVSIVIDIPSKTMTAYIDAKPIAQTKDIPFELSAVFGRQSEQKQLYLGKSIAAGNPNLNALIHDFRIYRVPLSRRQIGGIYNSAQSGTNQSAVHTTPKAEDNLPRFSPSQPQLYNAYLISVSDVKVETEVGNLPRLPSYVDGVYQNQLKGPKVRVIWPQEVDNNAVLQPGSYSITGRIAGTNLQPKAIVTVKAAKKLVMPSLKLSPFALNQVDLGIGTDGSSTKFTANRDKFINTLAKTDPNSFLYMFRHAFGVPQPQGAKPLEGWDSQDTKLRGHATGHYLTAIAQAYASTAYNKDLQQNFLQKMEVMVNALYDLAQLSGKPKEIGARHVANPAEVPYGPGKTAYDSDLSNTGIRTDYWNWGTGFISAYPPDQFIMLENGAKYGGQKTQIWAPYYTLHKILAGLLDVYQVSGNKKALTVASGMGDWVYARLNQLPKPTLIKMWNTYIAGEFGGMNETMAKLYSITRNQKYLKTAQLFDNIKVFYGDTTHVHGLAKNVDLFRGLHANQHVPQIVGSIEMYKAANQPEYYKIADNFWHKATTDYMYSIGGIAGARNPANAECFISQPGTLYENGFSEGGQNETCATYNMLKLTSDLFLFDQRAELMDYYERGLYNHILASVAKESAANTYHVPLLPGAAKQFGNHDMNGFTCCNGTAIESNTKLQNSIYFKSIDNQSLYVNLFIPSTLNWTERNVTIKQSTNFPKEDHTQLTIHGNGRFDVHLRVPSWATKGFMVKINGKEQHLKTEPGTYVKISRNWKNGDVIELKMPFEFHLDPVMDQQNIASLFYGPILLAAQEPEARKEWRKITLSAADISNSIKGNPAQLEFNIDGTVFKPFYESYGRYSVYLDVELK